MSSLRVRTAADRDLDWLAAHDGHLDPAGMLRFDALVGRTVRRVVRVNEPARRRGVGRGRRIPAVRRDSGINDGGVSEIVYLLRL